MKPYIKKSIAAWLFAASPLAAAELFELPIPSPESEVDYPEPAGSTHDTVAVLTDDAIRIIGTPIRIPSEGVTTFEWSADGKAFFATKGGSLLWIPVDGGEQKVLASGWDWVRSPKPSPDGKQVLFVSYKHDVGRRICVLELDGNSPVRQYVSGHEPVWSENGQSILFEEYGSDGPRLYQLDPDTGESRPYTPHPFFKGMRVHDIETSPDGRTQVVSSDSGLHLFDVESQKVHQLTDGIFYEDKVSFSPDGKCIVFRQQRIDPKMGRVDPSVVEFNLDTRRMRTISDKAQQAAFAPKSFHIQLLNLRC
ncbi:MAG: hypothetical protein R3E58_18885 [Phycisphaerae bacterium]|nr:hypothetical protein [Phycisphaerales bacterium]